jgi:hypothetical protein
MRVICEYSIECDNKVCEHYQLHEHTDICSLYCSLYKENVMPECIEVIEDEFLEEEEMEI